MVPVGGESAVGLKAAAVRRGAFVDLQALSSGRVAAVQRLLLPIIDQAVGSDVAGEAAFVALVCGPVTLTRCRIAVARSPSALETILLTDLGHPLSVTPGGFVILLVRHCQIDRGIVAAIIGGLVTIRGVLVECGHRLIRVRGDLVGARDLLVRIRGCLVCVGGTLFAGRSLGVVTGAGSIVTPSGHGLVPWLSRVVCPTRHGEDENSPLGSDRSRNFPPALAGQASAIALVLPRPGAGAPPIEEPDPTGRRGR
jgi:hypothetical protein